MFLPNFLTDLLEAFLGPLLLDIGVFWLRAVVWDAGLALDFGLLLGVLLDRLLVLLLVLFSAVTVAVLRIWVGHGAFLSCRLRVGVRRKRGQNGNLHEPCHRRLDTMARTVVSPHGTACAQGDPAPVGAAVLERHSGGQQCARDGGNHLSPWLRS